MTSLVDNGSEGWERCIGLYRQRGNLIKRPSFVPIPPEQDCVLFDESVSFREGENIRVSLHPNIDSPHGPHGPGVPHCHNFFEIAFVYRGQFRQQVDGEEFVQAPGELVLLNLGAKHVVQHEGEESVIFNILMRRAFVERTMVQLLGSNRELFHFFLDSIYGIHKKKNYLVFRADEEVAETLLRIIAEDVERREYSGEIIFALLLQLFFELARLLGQPDAPQSETRDAREIVQYIRNHCATVTLQSVSERYAYSTRQLSRLVKKGSGKSFTDLVNSCRVENACLYLQNSELPMARIVEIAGFGDRSYFYRVFKKHTGMTGAEFRRRAGGEK